MSQGETAAAGPAVTSRGQHPELTCSDVPSGNILNMNGGSESPLMATV